MCGIFGVVIKPDPYLYSDMVRKVIHELARAAEMRGKDSSGLAFLGAVHHKGYVFKGNVRISQLLRNKEILRTFKKFIDEDLAEQSATFVAMGHSRLVTNGSQLNSENNQPVVKDGVIGIHNGIITNDSSIWERKPNLMREYTIDTEVLLAMIGHGLRSGCSIDQAIADAAGEIQGTWSVALLFEAIEKLTLATNNGSLYYLTNSRSFLAFASEEWPLRRVLVSLPRDWAVGNELRQVVPNQCVVVSFNEFTVECRRIESGVRAMTCDAKKYGGADGSERFSRTDFKQISVPGRNPCRELVLDIVEFGRSTCATAESNLLEYQDDRIANLRRCSLCVLPETFPYISFDDKGVCNYCNGYKLKNEPKPFEQLEELVKPYRRHNGKPDCIVPFSGGRDSSYALHIIKNRLKLNPIAFTYDWGMVTDLGRRNIARVCGRMGVENIIIAADIHRKRENIRRNIQAWLKRPHLGMIPLFMAGDKYFYYHCTKVAKRTGIKLNIWGINPLENTDFKVGFLKVPPDFNKEHIYSLSLTRQLKLLGSVSREVVFNPAYINRSVLNSLGSFVSRSVMPHTDYLHLYDYVRWDEAEIERVLFDSYDWERACDTETTWRIGDGTAAFYNYIYYTVAGFSEHDTFRSNQVREGQLTREQALVFIQRDNRPRYPTIKWYLQIVGLDYESTVRRINSIPKAY